MENYISADFPALSADLLKKLSFSFDWLVCVSCNWQTIWFNWLRVQRHSNLISKRKFQLNNIKASRECLAKQKINKLINWNLKHKNGYDFFSSKHFVTGDASNVVPIWFSKLFSQPRRIRKKKYNHCTLAEEHKNQHWCDIKISKFHILLPIFLIVFTLSVISATDRRPLF